MAADAPPPAADDPCVWMIVFEDAEMPAETFAGPAATAIAHRRFAQVRIGYNCHLFVRVAHG